LAAILKIKTDTYGTGGFEMLPYYENKVYIDHSKKTNGVSLC
jgi:hypothetical protein